MKTLVLYSSLTGNTKKVAEAVAQVLPDCELHPLDDAPASLDGYGLVAVGWWAAKGLPDVKTREWLKTVKDARLAFFGTLGARPDSPHARDCMVKAEELALFPERGNTVFGTWMCQGRIDDKVYEVMKRLDLEVHRDMLKDSSRFDEAAKHPDEADLLSAQLFFQGILAKMEGRPMA